MPWLVPKPFQVLRHPRTVVDVKMAIRCQVGSSRVARPTVRDNMVKDKATVVSNNQATASQDMSMLVLSLYMPTFSLTALLLVSKLKATVDQAEPRKAIAAS